MNLSIEKNIKTIDNFSFAYSLLPIPIIIYDTSFRIISINKSFEKLYRYSLDKIKGKNVDFILEEQFNKKVQSEIIKSIEMKDIWVGKIVFKNFDGINFFCETTFTFLKNDAGAVIGIVSTQKDITEHLEIENKLKTSIDYLDEIILNLPVGIAILEGDDFIYSKINQSLAEINGLSIKDHLGRPLKEVIPQAAEFIIPRLKMVLETGEATTPFEFSAKLPKNPNNTRWFWDRYFPVYTDGKITAVGVIVVDITERKIAEQTLKEKNEELLILDKIKSEFVSAASHELRTPLTSIKASLGLLKTGEISDEESEKFIDICYNNTDRLIRIINEFLDLSKLESQSVELKFVKFDLALLIKDTVSEMKQYALSNSKNIIYAKSVKIMVYADKDRISQVLVNLLSNAIKFSDGNEINVSNHSDHNCAYVFVDDTSKIIEVESREKLFEPFVQNINIMKRDPTGTGLGLSICKSIIELHKGKIWIEQNGDIGNRFVFSIPLK